jgi:hypothetical protein
MKESLARIHRAHLLVHLLVQHLVQIRIVAVRICQLAVVLAIAAALLEMFRRVVKVVTHVGFGPRRWNEINLEFVQEFSSQIFQKK